MGLDLFTVIAEAQHQIRHVKGCDVDAIKRRLDDSILAANAMEPASRVNLFKVLFPQAEEMNIASVTFERRGLEIICNAQTVRHVDQIQIVGELTT